ncbi:MAG: sulfotransferase family 2 domain-containing protein [Deltaproteobacteria bacterium]|nr:sulfotransferase family 2 domain-containing protein [Deltaproteobacteria bacterium]
MILKGEIAPVAKGLKGWVLNAQAPGQRLKMVLSINGIPVETSRNWRYRSTLRENGTHPTGRCGFQFGYDVCKLKSGDVLDICEKSSGTRLEGAPFTYASRPLYFMHIPKTAGSAVNAVMMRKMGPQNSVVHINRNNLKKGLSREIPYKKFVSGHMRIHEVMTTLDISSFCKATLLRDPFKRLISNIAWSRRLAEPEMQTRFEFLSRKQQTQALYLKSLDLANMKDIQKLVDNKDLKTHNAFDNIQTRMLLPNGITGNLTTQHLGFAQQTLKLFDVVGINEQLESFVQAVCEQLSIPVAPTELKRVNVQKNNFGLDPQNPELKQILRPLYQVDEELYQLVKNRLR